MNWNKHSEIPEGSHSFLSGSKYGWIKDDEETIKNRYMNYLAVQRGVKLHEFAKSCIELGQKLPTSKKTLNRFVNDAIGYRMRPEQIIFYSPNAFGTADAISFHKRYLRIHDLKTGKTPASFHQLEIYAAYFCLEYGIKPGELAGCELRIYQNNDIQKGHPEADIILPIMDKIIIFDKIINNLKGEIGDAVNV